MSPKVRSAIFKAPTYPLKRRRTKKLHRELLDQLEFYMSEANIRHDAFMRDKTGEQGTKDVSINILLSFPLIQEMKATANNVIKAVEKSVILELSDDKLYIHRRFPVNGPPHNLDESTLYIENLPPDSTIEWLKEVCHKTGAVRHVSLPRYKKSGHVKGFAFVEYASPEDVARACRIFCDPPSNFYPSRTEYHLTRVKRVEQSKTVAVEDADSNTSATSALEKSDEVTEDALPKCQSESPVNIRKRKIGQDHLVDISSSDESNTHDLQQRHGQLKKSRKVNLNTSSEELLSSTATSTPRKDKSVIFAVNHENTHDNISVFAECNGNASVQCEHIHDSAKRTVHKQSLSHKCHQPIAETHSSNVIRNPGKLTTQINIISGFKRRRSEPTASSDEDVLLPKRLKAYESNNAVATRPPVVPSTIDGINAIINQARHAAGQQVLLSSPTKPIIQSVILKSTSSPRKSRSKTSRERKRLRAGRIPPNLSVMPKVEWLEFKKEYKKLQKQNMSKLKRTIRENKDAGSVFIKKHLDVLRDVKTCRKSQGMEDGEMGDIKEHSLLKRGAPQFQPGVIVKIASIPESSNTNLEGKLSHKLPSIEEIKTILNQYGQGVAYVDVSSGIQHGFVRFNDGESAQRAILEEKSLALCLLTGEQEEQYWDKLLASRARKFSQERRKIRGRTKILSKAEMLVEKGKRKHIRFDNDFHSV